MIWEKATHLLPDAGTDGCFIPDDARDCFWQSSDTAGDNAVVQYLKKLHFNTLMNKIIH